MLTMVHANPARIQGADLTIDRKFLTGMARYAAALPLPLATVHPAWQEGQPIMDAVTVPLADLPYRVEVIDMVAGKPTAAAHDRLGKLVRASQLVYGEDFGARAWCRRLDVPYVPVLEYDLRTQILVTTSQVDNPFRKVVRALRCTWAYAREAQSLRRAARLHCNGFPIHREAALFNSQRLLFLDSRMAESEVVSRAELDARLATRHATHLARPPIRLLFSGRYEPIKGSLDAVKVAVAALDAGLDVELHTYGQGSLRHAMAALAAERGRGRVFVHGPIPYPELITRSREFDLFVCCHVQSDPSCTYVESFGAGLPIVGYANRMWRHLQPDARCGAQAPIGDVQALVAAIRRYANDPVLLAEHSHLAREYAQAHCFEREFEKRIADLIRTAPEPARRLSVA
jgi:glycosyltransferase involved in cell wall biosynthesis